MAEWADNRPLRRNLSPSLLSLRSKSSSDPFNPQSTREGTRAEGNHRRVEVRDLLSLFLAYCRSQPALIFTNSARKPTDAPPTFATRSRANSLRRRPRSPRLSAVDAP